MADTIKSANVLKLEAYFEDKDTRTIDIDNPRDNVTAAEINAVADVVKTTKALIGDKAGAPFVRFSAAKVRKTTRTDLDLR